MAQAAASSASRRLSTWRLPSVSPAVAFAIRSGVAVSAALLLGKAPGIVEHNSVWILVTVLTVLQPTTGNAMLRGLLRIAGTAAGAFTAIALFGLFAQLPPLLVASFFLVQVVGAYYNSGHRFQYAWFVWTFTTAIILGEVVMSGAAVEVVAFERASMVGIGILLVIIVESLLWPTRAEPKLRASLAAHARLLAERLQFAVVAANGTTPQRPENAVSNALAGQLALADAARSEPGVPNETVGAYVRIALGLEALESRARMLEAKAQATRWWASDARCTQALETFAQCLQEDIHRTADALSDAKPPEPMTGELRRALLGVAAEQERLATVRGHDEMAEGFVAELGLAASIVRDIQDDLEGSRRATRSHDTTSRMHFTPHFDPLRTKLALRTGIAVTSVIALVMVLGWPMNTLVAPLTFLVAQMTRGASRRALPAMIAMIVVGWALADLSLVHLTPEIQQMPLALLIPFVTAMALGYLASTRPTLAMAPLLVGLVALLPVFGGPSAVPNVYGSYDTVSYMVLALAVGAVFAQVMWPITSARLCLQRIATQLRACVDSLAAARDGSALHDQRARLLRDCAGQMAQIGPLHEQARREPVNRSLDAARRNALIGLTTDLIDAVVSFRPLPADPTPLEGSELHALTEAAAREDEALMGSMHSTIGQLLEERTVTHDAGSATELSRSHEQLRDTIDSIRGSADLQLHLDDRAKRRWLVSLDARRAVVERQLALERWVFAWQAAETPS